MATGWVAEFKGAAMYVNGVVQAPKGLPRTVQTVTFTTAAATADAVATNTGLVGLFVDEGACFAGGASPVATTDDCPLGAEQWFYFEPEPGTPTKISFIAR